MMSYRRRKRNKMKDKEFMEQKAKDMNINELIHAIKIKIEQNIKNKDKKIELKKTLSDEIIRISAMEGDGFIDVCRVVHVKEKIEEFIDDVNARHSSLGIAMNLYPEVKEIFGKRFIE